MYSSLINDTNEKVIARKSHGMTLLFFILFLAMLALFIFALILVFNFYTELKFIVVYSVALPGLLSLIIFICFIQQLSRPEVIISLTGNILNVYTKNWESVALSSITNVKQKNAAARNFTYSFGDINIVTAEREYRLQGLADVDSVKTELIKLMVKYNEKEDN
jgi:hypothetical protein